MSTGTARQPVAEIDPAAPALVTGLPAGRHHNLLAQAEPAQIASLKIDFEPKKIIYPANDSPDFWAVSDPPDREQEYQWFVDGELEGTTTGDDRFKYNLRAKEKPYAERRRDFTITVKGGGRSATVTVRVAQDVIVGTPNVDQSNEGLDTFGWNDTNPVKFDMTLSRDEEDNLRYEHDLDRKILRRRGDDPSEKYGRLQFSGKPIGIHDAAAATLVRPGPKQRPPALVIVLERAFKYNREECECVLAHETRHCEHHVEATKSGTVWQVLADKSSETFSAFTEMIAYFEYVQSKSVSYKFLTDDNGAHLKQFVENYNKAMAGLPGLSAKTKAQADKLIQDCYRQVQYPEMREPKSAGWDLHIEPPPG